MKVNKDIFLAIKESKNILGSALNKLEGVERGRNVANYMVEESYFKNVYGKSYKEIQEDLNKTLNLQNDNFNIIKNMGYRHQEALLVAIRYITSYVKGKHDLSYNVVKSNIYNVIYDISLDCKKHLKELAIKTGGNDSVYTDLVKSIKLTIENERIAKEQKALDRQEKIKEKFTKEQTKFIEEAEEYTDYFGERKSNLR